MPTQSYANHTRWYPPHHFILYPLLMLGAGLAVWASFRYPQDHFLWLGVAVALFFIGFLSFMTRQHYALTLQNRLVRLEMRLRYHQLTGQRLEPLEEKLGFGRIAALRFAGDKELPALVERTLAENLSADSIKQNIQHWQADDMRV